MSETLFPEGPIGSFVADQVGGGTPSRQNPGFWNGPIPWASVKDFDEGQIELNETDEYITQQGLTASATNLVPANTPIVCTRMAVGRVAVAPMGVAINQDLKALFPTSSTDTRYLLRLADYAKPRAEAVSVGSTVKGIKVADYLKIQVPLAPPSHQSKIAEILDTLDAAIRGTEAVVAKLKAMKRGLLHDLLTRGIDANGDLRPPHPEAPHLYKQTPLGWLPKEWETSKLPGLAQPNRPVIRTGPFGSSLKGEHWRETGRPVITIGSFGENGFIEEELLFIDEKKAKSMIEYEVHPGDLVFSRVADVGRSLVVEDSETGWIMSSNLMRISVERKKLLPSLLHVQLRHSVRLRKQMSQLVNSAGRDVANSAVVLALDIAVPPGSEQIEIEKAIACNDEKLVQEEQQLDKLRLQKSGLMDDLLTGRTPVAALL
jgi:type I restriction enzyme S subunit